VIRSQGKHHLAVGMWETEVGVVKAVMKSSLMRPEKNPKASGNLQWRTQRSDR
jgi:hypothetical protein